MTALRRMVVGLAAFAVFACAWSRADAAASVTVGAFRYEIVTGVSSSELWHSSETLILSPARVIIRYFEFDWESAPHDGDWIAQGVLLAGSGDLNLQPVAIKLWSKERSRLQGELSRDLSAERDRAVAIFTPSLAECFTETACTGQIFEITATREGEVFVDKTKVGDIK